MVRGEDSQSVENSGVRFDRTLADTPAPITGNEREREWVAALNGWWGEELGTALRYPGPAFSSYLKIDYEVIVRIMILEECTS